MSACTGDMCARVAASGTTAGATLVAYFSAIAAASSAGLSQFSKSGASGTRPGTHRGFITRLTRFACSDTARSLRLKPYDLRCLREGGGVGLRWYVCRRAMYVDGVGLRWLLPISYRYCVGGRSWCRKRHASARCYSTRHALLMRVELLGGGPLT